MSRLMGELRNPKNGKTVQVYDGFSWSCLCLWFFWYAFKYMWGWAAVSFFTSGIGWLMLPFFANEQYRNYLLKKGYVPTSAIGNDETKSADYRIKCPHCAELIKAEAKICRFCGKELDSRTVGPLDETEILRRLKKYSPEEFERFVLEFLKKVEDCTDGEVTQRSRDGGIDGYVKRGSLGLSDILFQAKRWENKVGRPEVNSFVGALQGKKASQGVFVTTSSFTKDAKEYAEQVGVKVVLIDGEKIAELVRQKNLRHFIKEESIVSENRGNDLVPASNLISKNSGDFFGEIFKSDKNANLKIVVENFKSLPLWIKIALGFLILGLIGHIVNPQHNKTHETTHSRTY
jgi:hypothetical protein